MRAGWRCPKALEYDKAAIQSLQKMGVEFFANVDRKSFMDIAMPIQEEQAKSLGPYAVQLLELTRKVTT